LNKVLLSIIAVVALTLPVAATFWFNQQYVGWLIESVPDSVAYQQQWQRVIDSHTNINHPAVIHWLPETCLCRALSMKHAGQVTLTAEGNGYSVYQLNTEDESLGLSLALIEQPILAFGPSIAITRYNGQIAYVGAYSDGVRCNTGTSMVEVFIDSPESLPNLPVVGLDVKTCRCLP